jgi:hypothetical protein
MRSSRLQEQEEEKEQGRILSLKEMRMPSSHPTTTQIARRKPAVPPAAPAAGKAKPGIISEMATQVTQAPAVDPEVKRLMIEEAAYFRAEKRGFAPGCELQDWLDAESQVELMLCT